MAEAINIGGIYADLDVRSDNLERGLANGRKALEAIDQEIDNLHRDLNQGAISLSEFSDRLNALGATQAQLTSRMNAAYTATTQLHTGLEIVNANARQMTNSSGRLTQGIMQLGYVVDDLQYSFGAAVNNVAPLVGSFTGSAGLATAAQIGAVAIYQVIEHWDLLMDAIGRGLPPAGFEGLEAIKRQIKDLDKTIEELRKKPHLTAKDFVDLENAEKQSTALESAAKDIKAAEDLKGQTKEEKARGSAFTDAVREQGADNVQGALLEHYKEKAEQEGIGLGRRDIEAMLTDKGFAPGSIKATDIGAISKAFGVKLNAADMQEKANESGLSIGQQVIDALSKQKFLTGDSAGELLTPEQMTNRRIRQGSEGDKDVAKEVGDILDQKLPNFGKTQTEGGEVRTQLPSTFSKEFNENSPEAKEKKKADDKEYQAFKTKKNKTEADELQEADNLAKDAEDSGKAIVAMRKKNAQLRRENERKSREAAGGVDVYAEVLAGSARLGRIAPAEAQEKIRAYLKQHGRTDKQATAAAEDIYADADRKTETGIMERRFNKQTHVESFNGSDVAARIQASVSGKGDVADKSLSELKEIRKSLDTMARKNFFNPRFQ